jgi:hypothetical protein
MSHTKIETRTQTVEATFRYEEPDLSVPAQERSLFAKVKAKNVQEEKLPLHDYRTAINLAKGVECLDKHGFTLVENHLDESAWATEEDIRAKYVPSVERLVKNVTGCKTVIVNNVSFRRKLPKVADSEEGKTFYFARGSDFDRQIEALPMKLPMGRLLHSTTTKLRLTR